MLDSHYGGHYSTSVRGYQCHAGIQAISFLPFFLLSFFGKCKPHSHFPPFLIFNDFVAPVQNIYTLWLTEKLFNKCLSSVSVFNEF